jgi:hypothetical protein
MEEAIQFEAASGPGGGFIIASETDEGVDRSRIFVLKVSNTGSVKWYKEFDMPLTGFAFQDLYVDSTGILLVGAVGGDTFPSVSEFFLKLDPSGNIQSQKFHQTYKLYVRSIRRTVDNTGYLLVGGPILHLDNNGNLLSMDRYRLIHNGVINAIQPTADLGFVAAGYAESPTGGGKGDFWIFKVDAHGSAGSSCIHKISKQIPPVTNLTISEVPGKAPKVTDVTPEQLEDAAFSISDFVGTVSGCD